MGCPDHNDLGVHRAHFVEVQMARKLSVEMSRAIFSFPRSISATAMESPFERLEILRHWTKTEWPSHELVTRPVFETADTEERKRQAIERLKRLEEREQ
jgi:hypothetical protein